MIRWIVRLYSLSNPHSVELPFPGFRQRLYKNLQNTRDNNPYSCYYYYYDDNAARSTSQACSTKTLSCPGYSPTIKRPSISLFKISTKNPVCASLKNSPFFLFPRQCFDVYNDSTCVITLFARSLSLPPSFMSCDKTKQKVSFLSVPYVCLFSFLINYAMNYAKSLV